MDETSMIRRAKGTHVRKSRLVIFTTPLVLFGPHAAVCSLTSGRKRSTQAA